MTGLSGPQYHLQMGVGHQARKGRDIVGGTGRKRIPKPKEGSPPPLHPRMHSLFVEMLSQAIMQWRKNATAVANGRSKNIQGAYH